MRQLAWMSVATMFWMQGCWTPCDEPFSYRCKVEVEQCFDPVPVGCDQLINGFSPYEEIVLVLEQGISEGLICSSIQLGMCPDGVHYAYAVQTAEGRSATVVNATTGECVGATFNGDELDADGVCHRPFQAWTGPRDLWDSCAKAAYDVVAERRDAGCHPFACTQETDYCIVIEE